MQSNDKEFLIKGLIENFKSKGLEVTHASFGNYAVPKTVKSHKPDVIGWDPEKELYYFASAFPHNPEKENLSKFHELSSMMMSRGQSEGKRIPFYIGVPKDEGSKVIQDLDNTGIARDNIFTIEV